jgi:deoxyadenosine/deoxycytidine kinase
MASGPVWISIEGLIGAGKTTLLKRIKESISNSPITVIPEPVEVWQKSGLLKKSYDEETAELYAFPAQCHFFSTRINTLRTQFNLSPGAINVSERSPFSDKLFWELNAVDDDLKACYLEMWKLWQELVPVRNPSLFVYLRPTLETCMLRTRKRARPEDKDVPIEYQRRLMEEHDKVFGAGTVTMPDGTVVKCVIVETEEDVDLLISQLI